MDKYNLLAVGSCRICTPLFRYNAYNTWEELGNRNNSKCLIGRSWSINAQLELLKLIKGDKSFDKYVGQDEPIEKIKDNLLFLRKSYDDIDALVVEVSSLRYYIDKYDKLVHGVIHSQLHNFSYHNISKNEFYEMTEDFIDYCKKPIFFVSHFDRKRKDYREVIWEVLKTISNKNDNIFLIDISKLPNLSECLLDDEHFIDSKLNDVCEFMINEIEKNLQSINIKLTKE